MSALRPGDLIEIIAPGSASNFENLEQAASALRSWGYRVTWDTSIMEPKVFLANTDKKRFAAFKKAMTNKNSKAVWCLRGGYGAIRLLPELEKMKIPARPKLLIGLSDVSSLHAVLNQKWKWPSLHASLLDRLVPGKLSEENIAELRKTLESPDDQTVFANLKPLNPAARKKRKLTSSVIGGNLMVVTSTLGTPSQIKTRGKILFLEEISERSYRIDRCLQQMLQAGVFKDASAVVFGDFTGCDEPNQENFVQTTLEEFFRGLKIPAFTGVQTGHGPLQRPLFFNTPAVLTCGAEGEMLVSSAFQK